MVEENIMYQELQKVCREKVCRSIATYMYLTYSLWILGSFARRRFKPISIF